MPRPAPSTVMLREPDAGALLLCTALVACWSDVKAAVAVPPRDPTVATQR